jgi:hypothetical protein
MNTKRDNGNQTIKRYKRHLSAMRMLSFSTPGSNTYTLTSKKI